ncbi:hypothetical protein RB653_006128 [Dictyostelium firmibasis]|uniref:Transmembrane protein n=1 Tax=Dictyostelium firmibasis TaxID=79012 RepID=A0AAN7UAS9_9MYCE
MVNKRVENINKNDIKFKDEEIIKQQYLSPDENDFQVISSVTTSTTSKNRKNKAIVEKEKDNKVHEIIIDNKSGSVITKTPPPSSPKSNSKNEYNIENKTNGKSTTTTTTTATTKTTKTKITNKKEFLGSFNNNLKFVRASGIFMFIYYLTMMYVRYEHRGIIGFADTLWLCNLSIVFGFISIAVNKPIFLGIACNCTLIVHALWVVDVVAWLITGSFPLGNAEYISWPSITWGEIFTTTHHAWFVPLSMLCLHRNGAYPSGAWSGSMLCVIPVVYLSKLFPKILVLPDNSTFYLNINMVHEWWSDMNGWPFSLIPNDPAQYYFFLLSFSLVLFTTAHFLMRLVCYIVLKRN